MTYDESRAWMEAEKLRPFLTPMTGQWNWSNLRHHPFKPEDQELATYLYQELVQKNKKLQYSYPSMEAAEEALIEARMKYRVKKKG